MALVSSCLRRWSVALTAGIFLAVASAYAAHQHLDANAADAQYLCDYCAQFSAPAGSLTAPAVTAPAAPYLIGAHLVPEAEFPTARGPRAHGPRAPPAGPAAR